MLNISWDRACLIGEKWRNILCDVFCVIGRKEMISGSPIIKNKLCDIIIMNMMLNMVCNICCEVCETGIIILNPRYKNTSLIIDSHMAPDTHGPIGS